VSEQLEPEGRSAIPDLDIQEAAANAIDRLTIVRETRSPIEVSVEQGVVTLTGLIFTETMRRVILYNVSVIPGVRQVVDRLYTDAQLQVAVAQALAGDPTVGLRQPGIWVTAYHGVVSLSGTVQNENEQAAAIAAARSVPGIRAVEDKLTVSVRARPD
jgi:osmotically-inducible protein OsmY